MIGSGGAAWVQRPHGIKRIRPPAAPAAQKARASGGAAPVLHEIRVQLRPAPAAGAWQPCAHRPRRGEAPSRGWPGSGESTEMTERLRFELNAVLEREGG